MPIDPFFTSATALRSATARAQEKADPELLKLRGKALGLKVAELKRRRRNGERLSEGEFWFLRTSVASFTKKRSIGRGREALKIRIAHCQHQPTICNGFSTT